MAGQSSASVPFLWVSIQTPLFSSGFGLCFVLLLRLCLGRKLWVCAFQSRFCFSPPLCSGLLSVICPPVYAGFFSPCLCGVLLPSPLRLFLFVLAFGSWLFFFFSLLCFFEKKQRNASMLFFFFFFSSSCSPPFSRAWTVSGFYSQRTKPFLQAINCVNCRCNGGSGGGRPFQSGRR